MNDFVIVRRGAGQVVVDVSVDDELYVRLAGDGLIVATPIGSSAYSMAAGGPVLAATTPAVVCTPVAMHGGSAPPLVVPDGAAVVVKVHPSFAGFDVEIDGHTYPLQDLDYRVSLHEEKVTLVSLGRTGALIAQPAGWRDCDARSGGLIDGQSDARGGGWRATTAGRATEA